MEKGMEKGMEKIARLMLANHEPIEKIQRYTGFSVAAIKKLKAMQKNGRHRNLRSSLN
jgi:hypothetical protein